MRRPSLARTWYAVGALVALAWASPAAGQSFAQFGGGPSVLPSTGASGPYLSGLNFAVSLGWDLDSSSTVRVDGTVALYHTRSTLALPCPSTGCTGGPAYAYDDGALTGLGVHWTWDVAPNGLVYLLAGGGLYANTYRGTEVDIGISGGAGVAAPVAPRTRLFAEARWLELGRRNQSTPWLVPITIGLRIAGAPER